jgi:hypothetical protein
MQSLIYGLHGNAYNIIIIIVPLPMQPVCFWSISIELNMTVHIYILPNETLQKRSAIGIITNFQYFHYQDK